MKKPLTRKIPIARCRVWLTILWSSTVIFLLVLLILQTIGGHYVDHESDNTREVFGWFFPLVLPNLSLILSITVLDKSRIAANLKRVNPFSFAICFCLSVFYLVLVALPILCQPFSALKPLQLMQQSNIWLGPLQGLVAASLGVFFVKRGIE